MNPLSHSQARQLVEQHFALSGSAERERSMRLHLRDCRECSAWYERHLLLASLDPQAPSAERRLAAGLGLAGTAKRRGFSLHLGLAAAALAACLLLWRGQRPEEFASRGGLPARQLAEVFVYRVAPGQAAAPVGPSIHKGDELAFAYVNPAGFKKLMIFGVDEHAHVFWYHPAWSNAADNPRAIDISAGPELRELPAAIAHDLDGKQLKLHALFTNTNLTVRDVEAMLKGGTFASGQGQRSATADDGSLETEINLAVE